MHVIQDFQARMLSLEENMSVNVHPDNTLEPSCLEPIYDVFGTCGQEKGCTNDHDHIMTYKTCAYPSMTLLPP